MRRSQLAKLIVLTAPLLLSGCVGIGDKLTEIANETWLNLFAAKVDPGFFVSLTGFCLSFFAVGVGAVAIWGIVKWGLRRDSWPVVACIVLAIIAVSPIVLNVMKAISDAMIHGTPYGPKWIFDSIGIKWPPEGDLNLETLLSAAGFTIIMPYISMGWEIFVVLPFDSVMSLAAALTKSKNPLWLALAETFGWMIFRPVHYLAVSIIAVNKPGGILGALAATALALNSWYLWGTIILMGVLWIIGPALIAVFMIIVWIRGWWRDRQGTREQHGGVVAPVPSDGGGDRDGGNGGNGNHSPDDDNLDGPVATPSSETEGKVRNGSNSESADDPHSLSDDQTQGQHGAAGAQGAGESSGRYVKVKGAVRNDGDRTFIGWRNPDTKGIDWYPEGYDPNTMGSSENDLGSDSADQTSANPLRTLKPDETEGGDSNLMSAEPQTEPDEQIQPDNLELSQPQGEEAGPSVRYGSLGAEDPYGDHNLEADRQPDTGDEANTSASTEPASHNPETVRGETEPDPYNLETERGDTEPVKVPEVQPTVRAKSDGEDAQANLSDTADTLAETAAGAVVVANPVVPAVLAADAVLRESGLADLDPSANLVKDVLKRGNQEIHRAILHEGSAEETDLEQHSL